MRYQRETATDRFSNVIQVIQLGRKSGLLTVERGEGIAYEEGTITFVKGQATQANTGQYTGIEAFQWLNSWGTCRFAFISSNPKETTPIPIVQSSPSHSLTNSNPHMPTVRRRGEPVARESNGDEEVAKQARAILPRTPGVPSRTRQLDEALRLIAQLGLSRAHLRLFLLIDGCRSTPELVRLTGHKRGEVQRLLNELERTGVIQQ
jgi:hypothetical protein